MRPLPLLAALLAMACGVIAGPPGGDGARGNLNPTPRISMLVDGHVTGLVALKSMEGDFAEFTVTSGRPIKLAWSTLPLAVQKAFADDRLILLAARGASIEQSLQTMGASGLSGRIVQKVHDGVLVRLETADRKTGSYLLFGGVNPTKIAAGKIAAAGPEGQIVIIQNLPNESVLAYDEAISVVGFPAGTWKYGEQTLTAYSAAPLAAK